MSHAVQAEIDALLDEAESQQSCLVAGSNLEDRIRRALRRRRDRGELVSPARGLYARKETWEALSISERMLRVIRGLQEAHPTWVFCGSSAALVFGIDVSERLLSKVHVVSPKDKKSKNGELLMFHVIPDGDARAERWVEVKGIRVTAIEQTVFDCLRIASFDIGMGVADSVLRCRLSERDVLLEYFMGLKGRWPGRELAISTIGWADPRSENGGESIARARMVLLGFVAPELQVVVPGPLGEGDYRADFLWLRADGLIILGELDGFIKYVDERYMGGRSLARVVTDQLLRDSRLSMYNVEYMHFTFEQTEDPQEFAKLLDSFGVPRRGSSLALPDGTPMVANWEALRRIK